MSTPKNATWIVTGLFWYLLFIILFIYGLTHPKKLNETYKNENHVVQTKPSKITIPQKMIDEKYPKTTPPKVAPIKTITAEEIFDMEELEAALAAQTKQKQVPVKLKPAEKKLLREKKLIGLQDDELNKKYGAYYAIKDVDAALLMQQLNYPYSYGTLILELHKNNYEVNEQGEYINAPVINLRDLGNQTYESLGNAYYKNKKWVFAPDIDEAHPLTEAYIKAITAILNQKLGEPLPIEG